MRMNEQGVIMNKTLLSITAVLVALTVFFAACQSPVNPSSVKTTSAEEIASVSGPEWVKATAYRGAILVTWAFNKDAKTYSVYRQRTDGLDALVRLVTPNSTDTQGVTSYADFSHVDIVSPTNQLEDGVEYTYYVTANSGQGTTGRAALGGGTVVTDAPTVILDGAANTTVKAIIPARYSESGTWQDVSVLLDAEQEQVLNADAVKAEKVTTTGNSEKLLLNWPHYNPALKYTVYYDIGKALTLNTSITTPDLESKDVSVFYAVPLFGGENTARIVVALNDNNGEYYYKPLTVTKTLPSYALDILTPAPTITSVNRTATTAQIAWNTVAGAPNAANYKLYRIESPDVTDGSFTAGTQITVVGDWALVSIGNSTSQNTSGTTTTITVQDTGLTSSKGYIYALYAEVEIAKSAPGFYGAAALTVPTTTDLNIATYTVPDASDPDILTHKVTLGWTKQADVTSYSLLRAPITGSPANPTDLTKAVIGDFVAVGGTLTPDASGRYTVTDTPPIRKSYKYRLVAHDAAGSTVAEETNLVADPFRDYISSALTVNNTGIDTAYAAEVQIGSPSAYEGDLYVDIYRATVPETIPGLSAGYQNVAVSDTAFAKIADGIPLKGGGNALTYLDTGLTIGTYYVYRHVVRYGATAAAAVELPNTAVDGGSNPIVDFTGYVQTASVPSAITAVASATITSGSTTRYYYTLSGTPVNAKSATVRVQSRASGSTGDWTDHAYSGSIALYPDTNTNNLEWASTDTGVSPGDYYFYIATTGSAAASTNYRIVLADEDGNITDKTGSATTVLSSFTW
jgi:hypothetical protein